MLSKRRNPQPLKGRHQRFANALLFGISVMLLSGCGFQLRSWQLDGKVESILIANNTKSSRLASDLGRAIEQAGVSLLTREDTGRTPDLQVQLLKTTNNRRSVSVGGDARATEYELSLAVNYGILDADNTEVSEPRWIRVQRSYRINRNNLMGTNEEENILQREMRADVVQQILRAINQVANASPQDQPGDPSAS